MSDLNDLINTIAKQVETGGKVFVYYTKETGAIIRIANKLVPELANSELVLSPRQDVLPVLHGYKRLEDYVVSYIPSMKDFAVVEKDNNVNNLSINDRLFEIKVSKTSDYELKIVQRVQDKVWAVSLNKKIQSLLEKTGYNQHKQLTFTITKKNDPNVLIRRFEVAVLELIYKNVIEFPYENEWESNHLEVSIYTNKYFDNYKHEVKL